MTGGSHGFHVEFFCFWRGEEGREAKISARDNARTILSSMVVWTEKIILTPKYYSTITRGLVLTRPSVDRKKAHLCTTNTFISILFLREESSRQRYLDSYLQDNSGDMQYSASNPVRTEFHFSALHHGDYDVLWGAELWFVVCGCVLVR